MPPLMNMPPFNSLACGGVTSDTLLIHSNGPNGSTSFVDSGANGFTVLGDGVAHHDTSRKKFCISSIDLQSNTDYLRVADNAAFTIGAQDFTLDFWVFIPTGNLLLAPAHALFSHFNGGSPTNDKGFLIGLLTATAGSNPNTLQLTYTTDGTTNIVRNVPYVATENVWAHYAFVRSGTNFYFFVNGVQQGTTQDATGTWFNSSAPIEVGGFQVASAEFLSNNARVVYDEIRYLVGTAVWTTNFTPPTAPYGS